MHKNKLFYSFVLTGFLLMFSLPLMAWNWEPMDITAEARIAYYHPNSHKVRRIYGDGWADYQLEVSKGIFCNWRAWAGVSGFSREGRSIGFHDKTRLQLIPVSFGVKYLYPLACHTTIYLGGAACYSFLRIKDDSHFVHRHVHKNEWGGLIQSGICYNFCDWVVVSAFADYFFQNFHFHTRHYSNHSDRSFNDHSGSHHRFVERHSLNMNGYKIGVGLGVKF